MRKLFIFFVISLCLSLAGKASDFSELDNKGQNIVQQFVSRNFIAVSSMVDSAYQYYYTAIVLERDWTELTGTYGKFLSARAVSFDITADYSYIAYKIKFESLPYVLHLGFNAQGKINHISFMPAHKIYVAPDYCDVSKFKENRITVVNGKFELPGLLTMPNDSAKVPLVIIMVEAGPTDKDGSYNENRPYKDIAWGLSTQGFAVYRYEKRSNIYGVMMQQARAAYESFTPREDLLFDLYKTIDTLKTMERIDASRIYILGHGQGGFLAPLVAKERDDIHGIIMMGANAKRTQEMMIDQYAYLSTVTPEKKPEYDEMTKRAIYSMNKKLNPLTEHHKMPYDVQASYFVWLNNYHHLDIAKKLKKPMLILHGDRDYQVNTENYALWQKTLAKNSYATLMHYPKLNHLFYPGEGPSTYSDYFIPGNVPEYVIKDITNWLSTH